MLMQLVAGLAAEQATAVVHVAVVPLMGIADLVATLNAEDHFTVLTRHAVAPVAEVARDCVLIPSGSTCTCEL